MEISLTTPALLFPAISLLMLAYTNRFLTIATIIRNLHDRYRNEASDNLLGQIANLRYRIYLIRDMQIAGVLSLLFCVTSMFALFALLQHTFKAVYLGASLVQALITAGVGVVLFGGLDNYHQSHARRAS